MASINKPNRITLDAYSDPTIKSAGNNGVYSSFTNRLATPVLNAKAVQLLNTNFVNSSLQLNDYSLCFFYAVGGTDSLSCVRLHPASYVPYPGFTEFVKNKYFNDCAELVAALNQAAVATGDNATFNSLFTPNTISFAFDEATRRITISHPSGGVLTPVAADDPRVLAVCTPTSTAIMMNGYTGNNLFTGSTRQPRQSGFSMNARLGFAMSYLTRGVWWNGAAVVGNACATGVKTLSVEADANPILLGNQNVNVYLSITNGAGLDSQNRKSLAGCTPIEFAPLNVNSYTYSSLQAELLSVPSEIYEIQVLLLDENGFSFIQSPNYNTQISIAVFY